jgi:hypothetical protein
MDELKSELIEVVFVGGPLHGTRAFMAQPDLRMEIGDDPETIEYCRRMVEMRDIEGAPVQVATYAPYGMPEHEFTRLVIDLARRPRVST